MSDKKVEDAENPLVSVLICTYNRADHLKKCLDSIMDQTYDNFEVIIINGPSTDETNNLLKKYPFKCIQQINKSGLSAARNLGVKEAKGEIIAFIDDDAVADKNWIKSYVRKYDDEKVGGVGGKIYSEYKGKLFEYKKNQVNRFGVLDKERVNTSRNDWFYTTCGCNMSFRRKVLEEIGGFDEYYDYWFDETDVSVRIAKAGYKIEFEKKAIVFHYLADGPSRANKWYHKGQKQIYFTFKNFGNELSIEKILFEDFKHYIYDMIYITVLLFLFKMNITNYMKSSKNMITGRIQGYKDGINYRKDNNRVI